MGKRNTIEYVCYNEECKHNKKGFCYLKGVKPGSCVNGITLGGMKLGLEWRDKEIATLKAKFLIKHKECEKRKEMFIALQKKCASDLSKATKQVEDKNREFEKLVSECEETITEIDCLYREEIKSIRKKYRKEKKAFTIKKLRQVQDYFNNPFDNDGCFKTAGEIYDFIDEIIKELKHK